MTERRSRFSCLKLYLQYSSYTINCFVQLASAGDPEACAEGWRKPVYKKLHDCVG